MKIADKYHTAVVIALFFFLLFLMMGGYALSQYTLVPFGVPLVRSVVVSLIFGMALHRLGMWAWLTGTTKFLLNYLCCSVCTCVLVLSLFYVCNYAFADDEGGGMRSAVIETKFHKVRHKSRRVGRNRYVQGEAYNVYYIKVRFDNDLVKELQVERNRYTRLHKGDTLSLFVSKGALGIPVLKYNRMSKYEGGSKYRDQFSH